MSISPNFLRLLLMMLTLLASSAGCQHGGKRAVIRVDAPDLANANAREGLLRGVAAVNRGEIVEAKSEFRRAIRIDPTYGAAHNNLGLAHFRCGEWQLAAESFRRATEFLPERPEPVNNLGLVYEAVDDFENAFGYYLQAHLYAPETPEYLANLVRTRVRRGDQGEELRADLRRLQFIETRPTWKSWVEQQLVDFATRESAAMVPQDLNEKPMWDRGESALDDTEIESKIELHGAGPELLNPANPLPLPETEWSLPAPLVP